MSAMFDLADQIRTIVVTRTLSSADIDALADRLKVPATSVHLMLAKERWDLSLGLTCLDALGLKVAVTAERPATEVRS